MKDKQGQKIVVSGATGMVGAHLIAELINCGYQQITIAVREGSNLTNMNYILDTLGVTGYQQKIKPVEVELLNPHDLDELLHGCDKLFHCAAEVSFSPSRRAEIIETNTRITSLMVDAAIRQNVGVMVHVSSIAAMGAAEYPVVTDEKAFATKISGWSAYATGKFYSENQVWRGIKMGLNAVIINPGVILGIGNWNGGGSAGMFHRMAKGIPFYTEGMTGYVDARDVARAMVALSENPESWGKRYMAVAQCLSFKELMNKIADAVKAPRPWIKASKTLLIMGWIGDAIVSKLLRRERTLSRSLIRSSRNKTLYYSDLIRQTTNIEYRTMDETIAFIADKYRNR